MTAAKGNQVLIKVDTDGAGTYADVGGIRSKSISFNEETVDVTDGASANRFRELLEGAGVKSVSISGSGVFKDSATEKNVFDYWVAGTHANYQFIIPGFYQIQGAFQITNVSYAGEYNGEATFDMSFESAGDMTFTAI